MSSSPIGRETAISSIIVDGLFDLYDYHLETEKNEVTNESRLLILYGDNGSGKTTILKMVFHLLSPEDDRGHRTYLAEIPFRRFSVTLGGRITVEADRPEENRTGPYRIRVIHDGVTQVEVQFVPMEQRPPANRKEASQSKNNWNNFISALQEIGLSLYYLPDDREPESPLHVRQQRNYWNAAEVESYRIHRQLMLAADFGEQHQPVLETTMREAEEWIRAEALRAASIGEADTNKIYFEIVKRVSKSRRNNKAVANKGLSLADELTEIAARSKAFSTLGLMSPLDVGEMLSLIEGATPQKQQIISEVLRPYVNGLAARLNALKSIQELMRAFLEGVNGFFVNKRITFDLPRGIEIRSGNGELLAPNVLSSGEKQLLLLFCNTVTARQNAGVFIIDEPEISLNVKWQRKLLHALLALVRGTHVQFLVATHSIELLTPFRSSVLQLASRSTAHAE